MSWLMFFARWFCGNGLLIEICKMWLRISVHFSVCLSRWLETGYETGSVIEKDLVSLSVNASKK